MNKQDDYTPADDEYKQRKTNKGYVWLKLFTDIIDEPKFMRLSDMSKAVYLEVYVLAGRSDASGLITSGDKPAIVDDLSWLLHRTADELQGALDELQSAGLVDLQDGQITVRRFASEQGPSMADKRAQWAYDQRLSRARAKGEKLPDQPDKDKNRQEVTQESRRSHAGVTRDIETGENSETVKDLKTKKETDKDKDKDKELKTQTKRVSSTSEQSQYRVRADIDANEGEREFEGLFNDVLVLWHDIKGREYIPTPAFSDLIKYWVSEGVELSHIRKALEQVKDTAITPFYLRDVAINAKSSDPKIKEQANLDHFRELYRQQKNNGGNE